MKRYLVATVLFSCLAAGLLAGCKGEKGPTGAAGETGTTGTACTVVDNHDGTSTIRCADGTTATVPHAGADGGAQATSCSVHDNGNGTATITCTDGTSATVGTGAASVDYSVLTPDELAIAKIGAVVTGITIPADGRPVVTVKVTERHGSGIRALSATAVTWRFALLKLAKGVNGSANDTWVSYMAANDHSTASTETAVAAALTDNADGTYTYRFAKAINAGVATTGTTYEPTLPHRLVILLYGANNVFTPINVVKEFVPSTGVDITGQNDRVDVSSCLECHTQFRATAGATGALGSGEFHGGVRYDVRTCAACHNDQKRFTTLSATTVNDSAIQTDGTWTGNLAVLNNEAFVNLPVFIHKIHMGDDLKLNGGSYQGFPAPQDVTYPQDIRNCVKCHRAPAPFASNWKDQPSRRACASCHDDVSFTDPPPPGRHLHAKTSISSGLAQPNDNNCLVCHGPGGIPEANIIARHLAVSPPNPLNVYVVPTPVGANSNTNAAYVAAAGTVPPGARSITYDVGSVSTWDDTGVTRPQIVFKLKLDGKDVVFPASTGSNELIPGFVGSPSAYFAFSVPQETAANHGGTTPAKVAPSDFNASGSAYLRNIWNGTGKCSGITATTTSTGDGLLTGPDATGYYTLKLKCVVVPAGAAMLTGGIGYTYSLGSVQTDHSLDFKNNNLPMTQIDVPGYPFTLNPSGYGGTGGLIVPAPDVSKVATGFVARRSIVETARCNSCHVQLGVGPDFHAGQRNDAATCNFCHKPNQTSSGWSANMKDFVHSLHGAEKRGTAFTWHEKSLTEGYWKTTYPAVLNKCETCHKPGTYDFSTTAMTDALPNMLPSAVGVGTYAPLTVHSPYVAEGTNYGAVFGFNAVTGVSTDSAPTALVTSPITAACSACHDSPAAVDHMQVNGGSFWEAQATAFAKPQQETCLVCHGPNRLASISLVHTVKVP